MKNMKKLLGFSIVFMVMMVAFCSMSFAATVGQASTTPDSGWKRFDDTNAAITYNGNCLKVASSFYNGTAMRIAPQNKSGSATFSFYGTKFRIISFRNSNEQGYYSSNVQIKIDGVNAGSYSSNSKSSIYQLLAFEKLDLPLGTHMVEITPLDTTTWGTILDAVDVDDTGYLISLPAPTNLTVASESSKEVKLTWNTISGATSYNIKRSTASGKEETIATTSSAIYTDTGLENGTTYYYVVTALNANGESTPSNEVSAKPFNPAVSLEVTSVDKAKIRDTITANVVIHNAVNICAEDIKLSYDTSKLEFVSAEGADGIKVYKEADISAGIKRYITASLGKANAANGDKILLKLTFKAKAAGEAKIDVTNGRISDNSTLEMDVEDTNCGEKTILIEGVKDVNRSGEFTLLDLGIDAWYYGDAAADTDTSRYDADVVENGTIDDADLSKIVEEMLSNPNYPSVSKS